MEDEQNLSRPQHKSESYCLSLSSETVQRGATAGQDKAVESLTASMFDSVHVGPLSGNSLKQAGHGAQKRCMMMFRTLW